MYKAKHYSYSEGSGETLLLLHGFPASHTYWRQTQRFLARKGYTVIAIDLLGFGNAPMPSTIEYTYDEHVHYIADVLKGLEVTTPISIIGHSMGGLLGLRYAVLHPKKVRKLILLHPPLYDSPQQAHKTIYGTSEFYRLILESKLRQYIWILLRPLSLFIIAKHTAISREKTFHNIVLADEIFEDFKKLSVSTLLLVGARDRPQYLANLKRHRLNKYITLRMENIGHHSVIFSRDLVRKAVLNFLDN